MTNYKAAFISYLDQHGIRYKDGNDEIVIIQYNADNLRSISVSVCFNPNDIGIVRFLSWSLGKVPDGKFAEAIFACNRLNATHTFVNFFVDTDDDIVTSADALVHIDTVGENCLLLVRKMVGVCDEAYPEIIKALWG